MPYRNTMDVLWTMHKASEEGNFFRMSNSLSYNKALATALNALPPGCVNSKRDGPTSLGCQEEQQWKSPD